jgi:hypothetical protein
MDFALDELVSFRAIDCMMERYELNNEAFEKLLDRKARMVTAVEIKKITHSSYQAYLQKYLSENKIKQ